MWGSGRGCEREVWAGVSPLVSGLETADVGVNTEYGMVCLTCLGGPVGICVDVELSTKLHARGVA